MEHPIYKIKRFEKVGHYTLRIEFDDETIQIINFETILRGPMYGALLDEFIFDRVTIDPDAHTLVWPNGADFDPATLHDWPIFEKSMNELVERSIERVGA